ncbi:hypothetical protein RHS01_04486 [Rhizoctonia solani]|uniref:Uncharacterized protein n=1 Tax=Rhizoctonia solani TaxID=456999 RepID=A0A8H7IIN7_9AGAM|nr:hypothetical protein RHS01_04486 [Rhizoctonia solani]
MYPSALGKCVLHGIIYEFRHDVVAVYCPSDSFDKCDGYEHAFRDEFPSGRDDYERTRVYHHQCSCDCYSASSIANENSTLSFVGSSSSVGVASQSTEVPTAAVPVTTSVPASTSQSSASTSEHPASSSQPPASSSQPPVSSSQPPTTASSTTPASSALPLIPCPLLSIQRLQRLQLLQPTTTSVSAPQPTTTSVAEPQPTTSTREPESTTPVSSTVAPQPTTSSTTVAAPYQRLPRTHFQTNTDAFPTSFSTTNLPVTSINDPSTSSTPFSSWVDSITTTSSDSITPTLIGTVNPTDVPTTLIPLGSLVFTHGPPAPEGANSQPTTATANPSGVIAGGTVAGVVGILVLAGVSRWVWKRGASERAVRRMYRDDMRQIRERTYGLEEGPGQWGRPAWRRGPGSTEGSV